MEYERCDSFAKEQYQKLSCRWMLKAISLEQYFVESKKDGLCDSFGNEVQWVLQETLEFVDDVVFVPMTGTKESLNVGQTSAIFMWEVFRWLE